MTLLEVKNLLMGHFLTKNLFSIPDDLDSIKTEDNLKKFKPSLIERAFEDLEKLGIVKRLTSENVFQVSWILVKPFEEFSQNVEISPVTADAIADLISNYNEVNQTSIPICDKNNIQEHDIQSLIMIIHQMLEDDLDTSKK